MRPGDYREARKYVDAARCMHKRELSLGVAAVERHRLGAAIWRAIRDLGPLVAILRRVDDRATHTQAEQSTSVHVCVPSARGRRSREAWVTAGQQPTGNLIPSTPPKSSYTPVTRLGPPLGLKSMLISSPDSLTLPVSDQTSASSGVPEHDFWPSFWSVPLM